MRWPLMQKCKGTLMVKKILLDSKLTVQLINYIDAMECFEQKLVSTQTQNVNATQ